MSGAIGPGDWVECVNASGTGNALTAGALYCIAGIQAIGVPCRRCGLGVKDGDGVFLVGFDDPCDFGVLHASYLVARFRPIYRPRADLIETLMQPVDGVRGPELEPA